MKTLKNFILVLTIPALFLFGCSQERDSIDPVLGSGETTQMVYSNYRGGATSSTYTNVVVDLIDTDADNAGNNGHGPTNGDNVTGYTMRQIEDALIGIKLGQNGVITFKN